jgi:RNA polymerase sigma factor (sigma-70 family)
MNRKDDSHSSDYFLWERFKKGDKKALSDIYYTHYPLLYDYGLRIYNDPSFVKDCIQQLFYELISKLSSLGSTDNIRFYLLTSFRRKIFKKLKKDKRIDHSGNGDPAYHFEIDASPEDKLISREDDSIYTRKINSMLDNLSSREREAIFLKYYKNMSYEEITEIMDINYESARKLVYRAVRSLRKMGREAFKDME